MKDLDGVFTGLIFWGFVLAVVVVPLYLRYRERKQLHETLRAYIARGETVPDEVLSTLRSSAEDEQLRRAKAGRGLDIAGIVLMFLAGGVIVFGAVIGAVVAGRGDLKDGLTAGPVIAGVGFIFGMIGAGMVTASRRIVQRTEKAARE